MTDMMADTINMKYTQRHFEIVHPFEFRKALCQN